jgi:anti-sigma regulatory factor (Ser/Thr protein kinase)
MIPLQSIVALTDRSGIAEARQKAAALASALGFDSTAAGQVAVAATEAAGNMVKHAGGGKLLLRALDGLGGKGAGIEVLALDQGKGMRSVAESMRDGHSTAGSPGTGLGALTRMTSNLDIWSQPGKGTLLRFEIWPKSGAAVRERYLCGAISLPKSGEQACGDGWALIPQANRLLVFVVDGLGHGPSAADAARTAIGAVHKHAALKPAEIMAAVHDGLRHTRGAAGAVSILQPDRELCVFCGVGNISASVHVHGKARSMVSHNGILGHRVVKMQEYQYPFPREGLFIAHSDGVDTHWDLGAYPGLEQRHPALITAALFRDHNRGGDDATVVAVRALLAGA